MDEILTRICCGTANDPICVLISFFKSSCITCSSSSTPSFNITYAYIPIGKNDLLSVSSIKS